MSKQGMYFINEEANSQRKQANSKILEKSSDKWSASPYDRFQDQFNQYLNQGVAIGPNTQELVFSDEFSDDQNEQPLVGVS